jgi:hypothetical protein
VWDFAGKERPGGPSPSKARTTAKNCPTFSRISSRARRRFPSPTNPLASRRSFATNATPRPAPAGSSPFTSPPRSPPGSPSPTPFAPVSPHCPPRIRSRPPHLRACQIEAITALEASFAADRPRALIQLATGAGKTYTTSAFTYRLIKFAGARRVLFLVDRGNLGKQAKGEFDQFVAPDTGRTFTEVYNVQHLTSNALDTVARVTICTIQRLYSILRGEAEFDEDLDELGRRSQRRI